MQYSSLTHLWSSIFRCGRKHVMATLYKGKVAELSLEAGKSLEVRLCAIPEYTVTHTESAKKTSYLALFDGGAWTLVDDTVPFKAVQSFLPLLLACKQGALAEFEIDANNNITKVKLLVDK